MEQSSSKTYYMSSVKAEKDCILKIDTYMPTNQKLNDIKYVREISGLGLAEAKKCVKANLTEWLHLCSQKVLDSHLPKIEVDKIKSLFTVSIALLRCSVF